MTDPAPRNTRSDAAAAFSTQQPIGTVARKIASGAVRPSALVEACLDEIGRRDAVLNAFITVMAEDARRDAHERERELAEGRYRGPLHGIPISIKDLLHVRGIPTTAASRVRQGHMAGQDALVVARLRAAGAVIIGKCNLHEFALGTTSDESAFGPVRNPHDPIRSPGGSSGGSAAAIAAGMCLGSVGTDTGGSIRIPASACGIVGLKPGFDELPCDGVIPLSTSLDHVGPLARTVEDVWLMYTAMAGVSVEPLPVDSRSPAGRIAVPRRYFLDKLDRNVSDRFERTIERLATSGVAVDEVAIPHADLIAAVYMHVVLAEAARYHAPSLDSYPQGYTRGIRLRLETGRYLLAEDYIRAQHGRDVLRAEVDAALAGRAALALPTLAVPPPPVGATTIDLDAGPEPVRAITLRLTQLFNLTGHPAISIPCGTAAGLPVGLQLVGRHAETAALVRLAAACERQISPGPGSRDGGTG